MKQPAHRRVAAVFAAAPFVIAGLAVTACGAQPGAAAPSAPTAPASRTANPAASSPAALPTVTLSPTTRRPDRPLPVAPGAGSRPQTMARPRAHGRAFRAMTRDLWLAVKTGRAALARQAFFPLAAYKQVKAIVGPAADWRDRLWADFALDVGAAHALLGHGARAARLVKVLVASPYAVWVAPGACYNRAGYWHVANSRVVYREHGQIRSFGIASLISWRGVWYVVHFGGVVRPAVGMTDDPAVGPGYTGPQGGC